MLASDRSSVPGSVITRSVSLARRLRDKLTGLGPETAARVAYLIAALSHACHYHPYELAPTAAELTGWLHQAAEIVTQMQASATAPGSRLSGRSGSCARDGWTIGRLISRQAGQVVEGGLRVGEEPVERGLHAGVRSVIAGAASGVKPGPVHPARDVRGRPCGLCLLGDQSGAYPILGGTGVWIRRTQDVAFFVVGACRLDKRCERGAEGRLACPDLLECDAPWFEDRTGRWGRQARGGAADVDLAAVRPRRPGDRSAARRHGARCAYRPRSRSSRETAPVLMAIGALRGRG